MTGALKEKKDLRHRHIGVRPCKDRDKRLKLYTYKSRSAKDATTVRS